MPATERILTDAMVEAIKAYFPRYPTRQAVVLPAAHVVNDQLSEKLGVQPGETTPDGRVTLEYAECLGACDFAPCMLAGGQLVKNLTPETAEEFVAACQ